MAVESTQKPTIPFLFLTRIPVGILEAALTISVVLACSANAHGQAVPRISNEILTKAVNSTVFLEVQRSYHSSQWWNSGTGFFLNEDGFILTNSHVAGDWLEWYVRGESVWVELTVIQVRVVIYPRTSRQKILPARVVAVDRGRDLALLKVNYRPTDYVEFKKGTVASLLDDVFVVGFPFGEMLTMDEHGLAARTGGYPEVSVNTGSVSSLRRDDSGRVVAVQTDAAINFGNSGGPMLNSRGELIGVVYSAISGGAQIGFAIAPPRVWGFIQSQFIRTKFRPPYVSEERYPILLSVNAGPLIDESTAGGTVTLSGADIPEKTYTLKEIDDEWRAVLEFPEPPASQKPAPSYIAEIRLNDSHGKEVAKHSYRINARHEWDKDDDGSSALPIVLDNEMTIQDFARKRAAERMADEGKELPDRARSGSSDVDQRRAERPVDLSALREQARILYKGGEYEGAAAVLAQIVAADPTDEIAADYLELARGRLALEKAAGEGYGSSEVVGDENSATANRTAWVNVVFQSPLSSGKIRFRVDGEVREPDAFTFNFPRALGGRFEHSVQISRGSHLIEVELVRGDSTVLGEFQFEEFFESGSRWTLRVDLPSNDREPTAFLVERRD